MMSRKKNHWLSAYYVTGVYCISMEFSLQYFPQVGLIETISENEIDFPMSKCLELEFSSSKDKPHITISES